MLGVLCVFYLFLHLYFTLQVDGELERISAEMEELNLRKEKLEATVVEEENKNAAESAELSTAEVINCLLLFLTEVCLTTNVSRLSSPYCRRD